jgi:cyanophycinase-like exopeptidase
VEGIGLLPNVAVLPHANIARGYVPWEETLNYLKAHRGPVGAVIDENAVLVLHGSQADVFGTGSVSIVDPAKDAAKPYLVMRSRDSRDVSR